jgi:hypothetical protein
VTPNGSNPGPSLVVGAGAGAPSGSKPGPALSRVGEAAACPEESVQSRARKEPGARRYAARVRARRVACMRGGLHAAPAAGHQGLAGAASVILGACERGGRENSAFFSAGGRGE